LSTSLLVSDSRYGYFSFIYTYIYKYITIFPVHFSLKMSSLVIKIISSFKSLDNINLEAVT
jgi:hypothetical protein